MLDDERLLRRLLSAWRASRDPALEEVIGRVGELVGRARGGPPRGKGAALETAWHALAISTDPGDVSRVLDGAWPKELPAALARIRALAALPPDPRISIAAAAAAAHYRAPGAREVQRAFVALLARAPSPRLIPHLDVVESARGESTNMLYADLRATIDVLAPTPAEPTLLAAARDRIGDRSDLDALWAEHAANPGDLRLRGVLADRLQEAGDPRGEFIALQLAGKPATKLLAAHIDAWTGPLPGVVPASRRFARGFLAAAHVKVGARTQDAIGRPEWATIEELAIESQTLDAIDVVALVQRMPLLTKLAAPGWAIERIAEANACPQLRVLVAGDEHSLPDRVAFPKLETFLVDWSGFGTRGMLSHARKLAEIDIRAGYLSVPLIYFASIVRQRRALELRMSIGPAREGLTIEGWNLHFVDNRVLLAMHGRRGRNLTDQIVETLTDAGLEIDLKPHVDLLR